MTKSKTDVSLLVSITTLLSTAQTAQAQYLYLSEDPLYVHQRFVTDVQKRSVDMKNFSSVGRERFERMSNDAPNLAALVAAGPISQICETVIVQFPKGQSLTFRTMHERQCFDWVITVSQAPEEIEAVTFMGRPRAGNACGPPAILPPIDPMLPAAGQIIPPVNDCVGGNRPNPLPASSADVVKACSLWPKMCG
jgi:hypothetical protein